MAISQEKSRQLEDRLMTFALNIIELGRTTPSSRENDIILKQLIRSGTSVGANYTETNNASSRSDFRNKIFIAKKEAAETRYWLHLITKG